MKKWKALCFAITGKKHKTEGKICQDFVAKVIKDDKACIVLADGAGSAKFSHIGASIVVNYIKNCFQKDGCEDLFLDKLISLLKKHAEKREVNLKDFASTLLFVGIDQEKYKIWHIGDGVIGAIYNNGDAKVLSEGFNGEFANETVFITTEGVEKFLVKLEGNWKQENIKAFFIMSDGMAHAIYNKHSKILGNLIYKLYQWFLEEKNIKRLKKQIKSYKEVFYKRTYDDLSLCILGRLLSNESGR